MSFWDGMELWEKMLLVLACAMVCTLVYAVTKLTRSKRNIKRHTLLAEGRKAHLENIRSSRHVIELKGEDVPFGIKALESGIQVEGIVISRPPTPSSGRSQQTLVGSDSDNTSNPGFMQMRQSARPLVYQPSPYITLPVPLHHAHSGSSSMGSSTTSVASASMPIDLPVGSGGKGYSDPLLQSYAQRSRGSRSGRLTPKSSFGHVPDPATLARLEGRSPPPSVSNHRRTRSPATHSPPYPSSRTQSRTPTPPDGQRTPTLASVYEDSTEESSRESDSSMESDILNSIRRPKLLTAYSTPVIASAPIACGYVPTSHGDLSLLHTHRLSHAAEVGQLLPRNSRASRIQSGGSFHSSTSNAFISPAVSNPVYALDIALPPTTPAVAVIRGKILSPEYRRTHSGPSFQPGEASKFIEDLWSTSAHNAERMVSSPPTTDGNNKPRKKRGIKARGSMGFDLEAQV